MEATKRKDLEGTLVSVTNKNVSSIGLRKPKVIKDSYVNKIKSVDVTNVIVAKKEDKSLVSFDYKGHPVTLLAEHNSDGFVVRLLSTTKNANFLAKKATALVSVLNGTDWQLTDDFMFVNSDLVPMKNLILDCNEIYLPTTYLEFKDDSIEGATIKIRYSLYINDEVVVFEVTTIDKGYGFDVSVSKKALVYRKGQ